MVQVRGYSEDDVDVLADKLVIIVAESMERVVTRVASELTPSVTAGLVAASSAGLSPTDLSVMTEYWLAEVDEEIVPYLSQVYTGSAATVAVGLVDGFPLADNPGVPLIPDEFTLTFLRTVTPDFVSVGDDVWEDVREILVQGVKNGESIEQIAAKMRYVSTFSTQRATEIARTATHAASESGSIAQLRFVGYTDDEVSKEWVSAHDLRVRPSHEHADNQVVPLNQPFSVGASSLDFPGDPSGPRSETRMCRCTMIFEVDNAPKMRCDSLLAAPVATACVMPTPIVDVSHIDAAVRDGILKAFLAAKISPAWGGAKIHKVIDDVRSHPVHSAATEFEVLAIVDQVKPGFTAKYVEWLTSPAGKKAAPHVQIPSSHGVAPITPPSAAPPPSAFTAPKLPPVAPKPNPSDISFTGKTLGSHGAQVWTTPDGERWLFKPQPQFATDIDIATAKIQSKARDTRPGVYPITLNGQSGSIQYMFTSKEAWPHGSFDPLKLSPAEIATLQQGQIFDWMISNFDTHSGQWIRLTDGSLFGTDKGQAFKFFGSDKLDWDYIPVYPLGQDKLTYSSMWKAFIAGKQIDLQDPTQGPLGEYIDRLMAIPDDEYKAILSAYAQFKPDPDKFLAEAVKRKNSLKADFAAFWARAQAERAKHVKPPPPPVTPPPVAAQPTGSFSVSQSALGDISGFDDVFKNDVLEAWIETNGGVKVTPAWGGSKLWKILDDTKALLQLSWAVSGHGPAPNELQILRILDELGGFKGKPKTYESVVVDWLGTAAGKKAVPSPPKSLKTPVASSPTTSSPVVAIPKPVSVVTPADDTTEATQVMTSGTLTPALEIAKIFKQYPLGDTIAYATKNGVMLRVRRNAQLKEEIIVEEWTGGSWVAIDYMPAVKYIHFLEGHSDEWYVKSLTGSTPSITSKIPGKMPGDQVSVAEIEASKYLWGDGEIIAEGKTYPTGIDQLISDGKGGVLYVHQPTGGFKYIIGKSYPASKPLPKSISGQTKWKLGTSALTPPATKGKPSSFPGKVAGDIVTVGDLPTAGSLPGKLTLAYSYAPSTQIEARLVSTNGILSIEYRSVNATGNNWTATDPAAFDVLFNGPKWYAATDVGDMPDAYKALLPKTPTGSTPVGSNVPSNVPGFTFGQSITENEIVQAPLSSLPPGTIIAEAMDATGKFELRLIINSNGVITGQTRKQGGDWKDSSAGFSTFYASADSKGWYASVGQVSSVAKAAQAAPPAPKKVTLTGDATHIPNKVVGDDVTTEEIIAAAPLMVDGQIIATYTYYGNTYRVFVVGGKLVQQKQTKTGAWSGSKIVKDKWGFDAWSGWKASNDHVSTIHLKNAHKFVTKKTAVVPPAIKHSSPKPGGAPKINYTPPPIDLSPWNPADYTLIYQTLKAQGGTSYASASELWDRIKKAQKQLIKQNSAKYSAIDEITIMRIFDIERAKELGVTNTYNLEAKVATWVQTPAGKLHISKKMSAPVRAKDVPRPMHALDDPTNPDPDTQVYKTLTHQELIADRTRSHAKYGGWTGQQKAALKEYTGGVYSSWNAAIRLGDISSYRARIVAAQQGMRPSTVPMLLIRKASFSEFNDPTISSIDDLRQRVGERFVTRGFSSTSNTGTWSGTVRFEIECPIGTPMARLKDFSHYTGENETLLAAHLIYEIIRVSPDKSGGTKVRVRVVGAYDPAVGSW